MNEVMKVISKRFSCRAFKGDALRREDLQAVANAGLMAPSAMNEQPCRIIVVENKALMADMEGEGMRVLSEMDDKSTYERIMGRGGKLFYNAPCIIVVTIPEGKALDCGITVENMVLAAKSMGIDSVVCGLAGLAFAEGRAEEFKNRLGFEEGHEFGMSVLFGYAEITGKPHEPDSGKISFVS